MHLSRNYHKRCNKLEIYAHANYCCNYQLEHLLQKSFYHRWLSCSACFTHGWKTIRSLNFNFAFSLNLPSLVTNQLECLSKMVAHFARIYALAYNSSLNQFTQFSSIKVSWSLLGLRFSLAVSIFLDEFQPRFHCYSFDQRFLQMCYYF